MSNSTKVSSSTARRGAFERGALDRQGHRVLELWQEYVVRVMSGSLKSTLIWWGTVSILSLISCGYQINPHIRHSRSHTRLIVHNLTPYNEVPLIAERSWFKYANDSSISREYCPQPTLAFSLSRRSITWDSSSQTSGARGIQTRMLFIELKCTQERRWVEQGVLLISLDGDDHDREALTLTIDQMLYRLLSKLD